MAKSTTCSRAFVTPKLSWPTSNLPFCTPGMIVANVPFCTVQVTPRTLATALRRSTSNPTSSPSGVCAVVRETRGTGGQRRAERDRSAAADVGGQRGVQRGIGGDGRHDVGRRVGVGGRCRARRRGRPRRVPPHAGQQRAQRGDRRREGSGGSQLQGHGGPFRARGFRAWRFRADGHSTAVRKARVRSWVGAASTSSGGPDSTIRPAVQEDDGVGDLAGEADLVGDDDHGHPARRQVPHDGQHLADQLGVQRAGRLVEQHQLGLHRQRAGDGHPLLLAAGQLPRVGVRLVRQPDPLQQLRVPARPRRARDTPPHRDRRLDDVLAARSGAGTG